tara:strand:+ start:430 stop:1908 length:1479 start_codon:yes stop_codon:yes gene_type:complete
MSKQGRYIGIYDFLDNTPLDVANGGTGLTTVGTNNILTGNGTGAFTSESSLTWDGSDLIITSATSEKPKVLIENTTDDGEAPVLQFFKNHAGSHDDDIGLIQFRARASNNTESEFAEILAEIQDSAAGSEAGRITFKVAENDGTLTPGLIIAGAEDDDGDVNVTIGAGDDSIQNIKGVAQWDYNGSFPVKISGKNNAFGATDGHALNYGTLLFTSFNLFNTGLGGVIQQSDFSSGAVTGAAISVKGGGSYGTNKSGGNVQLIAGRGTGTGKGGSFKFYSAPAGSSGSSYNTTAEQFSVSENGIVTTTNDIELGHDSDTTLARSAAGIVTIQGKQIFTTNTPALTSAAAGVPAVTMQIRRTITTGEANDMHTDPIEIVPAQGANTVIVPLGGMIRVDRAGTQGEAAADLALHYEAKEPGAAFSTALCHLRRFMHTELGDRVFGITGGTLGGEHSQNLTDDVNKAVEVSFDAETTADCFTSIDVFLTYQVFNIS